MTVINPETLLKYINGFDFLKRKPLHPIKNRNAYVKLLAPEFPVEREVYGNYVDPLRFFNEVVKNVEKGRFSCQYDARRFYLQPKIKSDDKKILARRKYCKKYLNKKIEYLLGEKIHVISPVTLDKIIYVRKNGKIIYINRAINDFVESLAKRYNTLGGVHRIRPIGSRKKINVIGGNYGYMIDCRKEAMRLKKDLRSKKNIKREPIYAIRASGGPIDRDLGDKYVEINLSRQKLWLVEKGKIKLSSYVVTGNVLTGNGTPTGTYSITYMDREATLRGLNNDGTKYESRVSYWMPFNGNVGMHDAPWRGSFGGSIYRGGGSHGCVNMPPLSARTLFLKVKRGCPVVVHW